MPQQTLCRALTRRTTLTTVSALLAAGLLSAVPSAFGQADFPTRPIKLLVPFAPGGATDTLGRLLAIGLGEKLGQPVVVENKPGAGTVVAASMLAKAAPDGYTLLLGSSSTLTLNPALGNALPYDPVRSFTPLGMVADMGLILVATNSTAGSTLKDIVAQTKAAPDRFSYGSFGAGSSVHFGAEMLKTATGMRMVHVPFNGSSPSLTALMGEQVQLAVDTVVASGPLIKAGKIKAIALLSAQRLPALPQVPTVAESGYPGFEMGTWFALLAPAGVAPDVQRKLEAALAQVANAPEMKKKLVDIGLTPSYGNGAALKARIETELPRMRAVAARANIKVD